MSHSYPRENTLNPYTHSQVDEEEYEQRTKIPPMSPEAVKEAASLFTYEVGDNSLNRGDVHVRM